MKNGVSDASNNNNNNKRASELDDLSIPEAEAAWFDLSGCDKPATESAHIQRAWDRSIARQCEISISSQAGTDVDKARLLAASTPHSADWLSAPPIASVGLRLADEEVRIAVAHRLGCKACEPHDCGCGEPVDARGLHGLACRRSGPRQQRHRHLNDIIWTSKYSRLTSTHIFYPVVIKNGRNLAPSSRRTGQGDRKTDEKHHRRRERDLLPVPADVHSTAKGERGLISKHVHCQLVRCNRHNFSSLYL